MVAEYLQNCMLLFNIKWEKGSKEGEKEGRQEGRNKINTQGCALDHRHLATEKTQYFFHISLMLGTQDFMVRNLWAPPHVS